MTRKIFNNYAALADVQLDEAADETQVEAKNLKPFTTYYYQFAVCGSSNKSPLGRTKTSPRADDDVSKIGLAVFSCAHYGPYSWRNISIPYADTIFT